MAYCKVNTIIQNHHRSLLKVFTCMLFRCVCRILHLLGFYFSLQFLNYTIIYVYSLVDLGLHTWKGIHNLTFCYWCFREREEGVPRDLIAQHLGIPLDRLMSLFSFFPLTYYAFQVLFDWFWFCRLAIKNLIEEGAIYEAIADHYKSIINGWHLGGQRHQSCLCVLYSA